MKKTIFEPSTDGFYGTWYPCEQAGDTAFIMIHKLAVGRMAEGPARWFHEQGIPILVLAPMPEDKKEFLEYPVDRVEKAIEWMKDQGFRRFGIIGQSQTAMLSLIAASLISDITLTVALTPCDFVMEATKTTGGVERPTDRSFAVWSGQPLPFHRFTQRGDELSAVMKRDGKATGNMFYARNLFAESEKENPLTEEQMIRVENIHGKILFIGARDDAMWDTERYIERMRWRITERNHSCSVETHFYDHGTHYVFPQCVITKMLPASSFLIGLMFREGKVHKKECRQTREDIERVVLDALREWKKQS